MDNNDGPNIVQGPLGLALALGKVHRGSDEVHTMVISFLEGKKHYIFSVFQAFGVGHWDPGGGTVECNLLESLTSVSHEVNARQEGEGRGGSASVVIFFVGGISHEVERDAAREAELQARLDVGYNALDVALGVDVLEDLEDDLPLHTRWVLGRGSPPLCGRINYRPGGANLGESLGIKSDVILELLHGGRLQIVLVGLNSVSEEVLNARKGLVECLGVEHLAEHAALSRAGGRPGLICEEGPLPKVVSGSERHESFRGEGKGLTGS